MEIIEISQIFYTIGVIFLILLSGTIIWLAIAINKTLLLVRRLLTKIDNTVEDISLFKEGLKQGISGAILKLIERLDKNTPKKKAGEET